MAMIQLTDVSFTYDGSPDPVFTGLNCRLDTDWRLGLIGRNGRGKTTLLRLLAGEQKPLGSVLMPLAPVLFPFPAPAEGLSALEAMQRFAPDAPSWRLVQEAGSLQLGTEQLRQPFATLSRGQQTRAQLAALFARGDCYPMMDEPTNHLDLRGREQVAAYLARKQGFLLVSHDRDFLNRCVDHTLALNRATVTVQRGNYDAWERDWERRNGAEQARNEHLQKEAARLEATARKQADWSRACEKGKFHVKSSEAAVVDRGYVGARSAALMKRSLATQARLERAAEETRGLMRDVERVNALKLSPLESPKRTLVDVRDGAVRYGGRTVCRDIAFTVERGERIALLGANGAGKSSILRSMCGLSDALTGSVNVASGLIISYVPQSTDALRGPLRDWLAEVGADETQLKTILRYLDFGRQQFDKTIEQYSEGQKKKLLLARSLCERAHLYVWDEPLNYVDVFTRVQLENLLREAKPTMILVEHDQAFLSRVCTQRIDLDAFVKENMDANGHEAPPRGAARGAAQGRGAPTGSDSFA